MSKIVEISSYFSSKSSFKKSVACINSTRHQILVDYLTQFAYKHSQNGLYKTYLFLTSKDIAAAYISFSIATINRSDAKTYLNVPLGLNYPIPALKITRLLTSDEHIKKGLGTELLKLSSLLGLIISSQTGCKALVVDSKEDAVGFYFNNGYEFLANEDDMPDTQLMIKKIPTIQECKEADPEILNEFIEFCNNYSLHFLKASLENISDLRT